VSKLVEAETRNKIAEADIDVIGLLLFSSFHNATQLEKFCQFFISSNYEVFKKRPEWALLKKEKELFAKVKACRWPPKSYLADVAKYEKEMDVYRKKTGQKEKAGSFLGFSKKEPVKVVKSDSEVGTENKIEGPQKKKLFGDLFSMFSKLKKKDIHEDIVSFKESEESF